MARRIYEGSKADLANDRRQAKRHGMTLKAWERSPQDAREDAKFQRKLDRAQPHHFAHGKPRTE